MDLLLVSFIALWALVLLELLIVLALVRELTLLRRYLGMEPGALATTDGPKIGAVAPAVRGRLLSGKALELVPGRPTILIFVSAGCAPCRELLPELATFSRSRQGREVDIQVIASGSNRDLEELERLFVLPVRAIVDDDGALMRAFDIRSTPYAVALDTGWVVRSKGVTNRRSHLEALAQFRVTLQGSRSFSPDADTAQHHGKGGEVHGTAGADSR